MEKILIWFLLERKGLTMTCLVMHWQPHTLVLAQLWQLVKPEHTQRQSMASSSGQREPLQDVVERQRQMIHRQQEVIHQQQSMFFTLLRPPK